jgi:hypothetical protein
MARNQSSRLHLKIIRTFFHDSEKPRGPTRSRQMLLLPPALVHPAVALAPSTPMMLVEVWRSAHVLPCTSSVEQLNSIRGDLIDGALPAFTFATSSTHGALHLHAAGTAQREKRSVFRYAR